jgi:hypothetical protein
MDDLALHLTLSRKLTSRITHLPFLMIDLQFAIRRLLKNPVFSAVGASIQESGGRIPCG